MTDNKTMDCDSSDAKLLEWLKKSGLPGNHSQHLLAMKVLKVTNEYLFAIFKKRVIFELRWRLLPEDSPHKEKVH